MNADTIAAVMFLAGLLDDEEHAERFAQALMPQSLPMGAGDAIRQMRSTIERTREG